MLRSFSILGLVALTASCNTETIPQTSVAELPVRTNLPSTLYDFESGTADPLVLVRSSYKVTPELSASGLQLIPEAQSHSALHNEMLSEFAIDDIAHNGGLLKVRSTIESKVPSSDDWSNVFWTFLQHNQSEQYEHWGGGSGVNIDNHPLAFIETQEVQRLFNAGLYRNSQVTIGFEVDGTGIEIPADALNITGIEILNYPLSDTDLTFHAIEAQFSESENYCGFDYQLLEAYADIETLNGLTTISGEVSYDNLLVGTFSVANSSNESLYYQGSAAFQSENITGQFDASGYFNYHDEPSVSFFLNSCYTRIRFPIDWQNRIDDSAWQSVYSVDFTTLNDLTSAGIRPTQSRNSPQPELVNYFAGTALELSPQGISADEQWTTLAEVHTPVLDLPDNVEALAVSLDYDANLSQLTDVCQRIGLSAKMRNPNGYGGFDFGRSWASLNDALSTNGSLATTIYLPEDMTTKQVGILVQGEDCTTGVVDSEASIIIDNLELTPISFSTNSLTGPWLLNFSSYSDTCPAGGSAEINITELPATFTGRLDNGLTFEGQLSALGELSTTLYLADNLLYFNSRLQDLDGLSEWSHANDCFMKLEFERPE